MVWDYKKANNVCIKKALWTVNWDVSFHLKCVHEQVNVFNDVVINIFSNFVLNKIIEVDDRDPPWMNESYTKITEWVLISLTFRTKLNDPQLFPKAFWKIFKTFYHGNQIPLIPPIIVNDKLVSNYEEKANHFNKFLASQCTPIDRFSNSWLSCFQHRGKGFFHCLWRQWYN